MLTKEQEVEIDIRKYEYDLVNGKLALNIARLDKLWVALAGSLLASLVGAFRANLSEVIFTLMPLCFAIWLTLFLYVLAQIERQKICALAQANGINEILGSDVLIYDTKVMNKLWGYDKEKPSNNMILLNLVLIIPALTFFFFCTVVGANFVNIKYGSIWSVIYVCLTLFTLIAGCGSFYWSRKDKHIYITK